MLQRILALAVIAFFLAKLFWQQRQRKMAWTEFCFWLIFWLASAIAIIFLNQIDRLVANLGFSSSGIDVLLYSGLAVCLYFIFRLRLRLEKMDRQLTKITSSIARQQPRSKDINNTDRG
ncbi:MAG TPA: DUF2304 domain-containing protein [bacterium]|jgi:hypothetical protein|nr:DUF2304 domain-containing protein [bacterium]HNZ51396.1 DUF2304 domain-containing protein [bacterium]HOF79834.1 DUF2304 domain-containing protein [bacterium]HOH85440.1 DUF2304 domain-containing protein [bacterium]HOQ91745.1 DUF2304 domain-containing protein [bacterium]